MSGIDSCPFCGGRGRVVQTKDFSGYWYCECEKCCARQLAYSKDQKEAIRLWNTRHTKKLGAHKTAQGE